ncbi:hypothetical protein [Streptomyces sp. NPDC002521]
MAQGARRRVLCGVTGGYGALDAIERLRRGALKSAAETGCRLVIATRLKAFITVASQAMAEIWSGVSTAAAAS